MSFSKYYGLVNQGSTCYLNSVLQVLFMTNDFREAIESYRCDTTSLDYHLKELFDELKKSTASTQKLNEVLGISDGFMQSDAAECLENILSKVTSPGASQLFQGMLTIKNKCSTCCTETSTEDPFWSLPLELEDSYYTYDLTEGIDNYFKESHLREPNQLFCECCSTKSDATIKVEMKHHPEVLTLLLKRFKFDQLYGKYIKIRRGVKIPELLQIPPYGNVTLIYELYAFVEHTGELRNGHYIVTIKSQDDGKWYVFSDHWVRLTYLQLFERNDNEIKHGAYLLFYRKISNTDSMKADKSRPSTSDCSTSDHPSREDIEPREGQECEEEAARAECGVFTEECLQNKREKNHSMMTRTVDECFTSATNKPLEINNDNNKMGMGNKQIVSDEGQSKGVLDNQHNKQHQDLDGKQDVSGKHSEKCPTCLRDSEVFKSDTIDQHRRETEKAGARADYIADKEKEVIGIRKEEVKETIVDDSISKTRPPTRCDLMQQMGMGGFQNCNTAIHECKNSTTAQNSTDVWCHSEHMTSGINQNQKNLDCNKAKAGNYGQQRTEMKVVLNESTEGKDDQYVQIRGKLYEICEERVEDKSRYLILKEIDQANGEDFSKQNKYRNPECKINKLRLCRKETGKASESCTCGSEVSQEIGTCNQPGQMITAPWFVNQHQMTNSILSISENKILEKGDSNAESNHPSNYSFNGTSCSSLQGCNGAGALPQQSFGTEHCSSMDSLSSSLNNLSLSDESGPNKAGIQGDPAKSGTCNGNQPVTEYDDRQKANPQSDTQIQVENEETDEGSNVVCSRFMKSFY
ncbi:hypothetical protein CRENBAI_019892 [Crenichthys baileyi]|uniref:Ubiquitin carboxyl-terminal hydrolase n=1 Tax=Crenichthys baileyi TaxID=28760 RepID=A0AAV9SU64_9TELE